MEERKPITWKHYTICAVIAVALVAVLLWANGIFDGTPMSARTVYRVLSDAFLAPGALLVCSGGAVFFYQMGAFDGMVYLAKLLTTGGSKEKRKKAHVQTFAEFVEDRDASPKSPCRHFFVVGGICFALCLLFMVLNVNAV